MAPKKNKIKKTCSSSSSKFSVTSSKNRFKPCNSKYTLNRDTLTEFRRKTMLEQNKMRKTGLFCDVVLKAQGQIIRAHKSVLAGHCDYFRTMFTIDMAESRKSEIELHDIDYDALAAVVDFLYTGSFRIEDEKLDELLAASCMFQMKELQSICVKTFEKDLRATNCLRIHTLADMLNLTTLKDKAEKIICLKFAAIMHHEDFLALEAKKLAVILQWPSLSTGLVQDEDIILRAALDWLNYDHNKRLPQFDLVLLSVRLGRTSSNLLKSIHTSGILSNNPKCAEIIEKFATQFPNCQMRVYDLHPRSPSTHVCIIGGYKQSPRVSNARSEGRTIEVLKITDREATWVGGTILRVGMNHHTALALNHEVYILSTNIKNEYELYQYDLLEHSWTLTKKVEEDSMWYMIGEHVDFVRAVDHQHNYVYLCGYGTWREGGNKGSKSCRRVLRLDMNSNTCKELPPLPDNRFYHSAIVMDGSLYVVGGTDWKNEAKAGVLMLDQEKEEWVDKQMMNVKRIAAGLTTLNGHLYAIGGTNMVARQKTVERYNPRTNTWSAVGNMNRARAYHGVVTAGGCIYAVGGKSNSSEEGGNSNVLNSVEVYDPEANQWSMLPETMSSELCRMTLCVV
ncbi:kelch-like protein diablo [Anneissia japonica]|uniref:kelch-like protein diablo n=1 Tax=Anneissia japonica TaxID=1529436 RepID=UPI0014255A0E|nr:kelch-like protein diablo [Anneissia japonica]XP_033114965.1 kelch-like protein diablo [Anneissia japonica]XP_033114973.1 kelch-like protein diablo [Anneissia japonica]